MKRTGVLLVLIGYVSVLFYSVSTATDKHFVIVTTSYKNAQWYKRNLEMLFAQTYQNWHLIYTDDCSPDKTGDLVEQYVKENKMEHKVTLVKNKERKLALENIVNSIYQCKDSDIIISYDGDDWFSHTRVLAHLNHIYQDPTIWMTYGTFITASNNKKTAWLHAYPEAVIKARTFRQYNKMLPSHLRTFYAGLFKKINLEDLKYNGHYLEMAWDVAMMIPMIEMASEHFKFINLPLYIYNDLNEINDHRVDNKKQGFLDHFIRQKPVYEKLESHPY